MQVEYKIFLLLLYCVLSVYTCISGNICFSPLDASLLVSDMFINAISFSWKIIILYDYVMPSVLSDISIAMKLSFCFHLHGILFSIFHFKSLNVIRFGVFCRKLIEGSCLLSI